MQFLDAPGVKEGIARACSQAIVYYFDSRKTILQLIDNDVKSATLKSIKSVNYILGGAFWSTVTAGAAFYSYFFIYHSLEDSIHKGAIAAITSSFIKIPMGNCMRVIQSGSLPRPCLWSACKSITKSKAGIRGLYSGYVLNLIEDIVEIDLRVRVYKQLESIGVPCGVAGIIAGMTTAWVTHPLDTMKTRTALGVKLVPPSRDVLCIARSLYSGAGIRMVSNGVKSAMFFTIIDALSKVSMQQQQKK